jgi:hypothetical protein
MPDRQVFRFVSVRAPRPGPEGTDRIADPLLRRFRPTRLQQAVAALDGQTEAQERARALATEIISSDRYLPTLAMAAHFLEASARIGTALSSLAAVVDGSQVARVVEQEFGERPARLVNDPAFQAYEEGLWESLDANVIAPEERPEDRDHLVQALRVARLVRLVADGEAQAQPLPVRRLLSATPLIPPELFPQAGPQRLGRPDGRVPPPGDDLLSMRARLQRARSEVERLYRRNRASILSAAPTVTSTATLDAAARGADGANDHPPTSVVLRGPKPTPRRHAPLWRLSPSDLSEEVADVLLSFGLSADLDDVPQVVDRLTREIGEVNARLLPLVGRRMVREIGSSRVHEHRPTGQFFNLIAPSVGGALLPAGRFTPPATLAPPRPFRVLGVGDLIVARETLLRYEPGEVAHVENVLSGERKDRVHRRKRLVEDVAVSESERVEIEERELESTDRFELQKESERVVQTDVSAGAGLSVAANYGYVSVTATANFAYNNSRSESDSSASTYARNVTNRALSRIEERVREQRTRRTLEEFEETNTHTLDATGQGHVRGVYQWVDKIYSMQLINYGQRLMLEFVVPEPAAFYIFSRTRSPLPGISADEPIPPEELGLTSHRLLNAENLPIFVAAYRVEDVEPPPPERTVIGKAYDQTATGGDEGAGEGDGGTGGGAMVFTKADSELVVTEGYRAGIAVVTYSAFGYQGTSTGGYIHVGNNWIDAASAAAGGSIHRTLNYEDTKVPVGIVVNDAAFLLTVEIECELTAEKREAWQLATYAAIVAAYRARKAEYDELVARSRVRQGVEIAGRNPLLNRQIERDELKKSCISLLTGTRYEEFTQIDANAVTAYLDYPEIASGAVLQHASRIHFLEQAFEWDQMTYLLYPYFWGRKQNWLNTFPLDDVDPKFADFLRAGAARVVVPVSLVYAEAVLMFLASNEPWPGGSAPTLDDPLFRSIAAELRRQQGADFVERDGTVNVINGSRNVAGAGTLFTEDDRNREIMIGGAVYRIQDVPSIDAIVLSEPYGGATEDGVTFSVGATLVDQPWTIRVPTSLVLLRDDGRLPDPAGGAL